MRVYLDNAATTPLDNKVLEAMMPFMTEIFGNPSSIHSHGRESRAAIEKARKTVASLLNTSPSEIFFTSGGTEADNTAIVSGIRTYGIKHAISSPIEHHAVLHTLQALEKSGEIKLSFVELDEKGHVSLSHLETLLQNNPRSFVSLMHANNEISNLLDLEEVGELCKKYNALFHSDTVQTMGHYKHDLQKIKTDYIVGSAHKFHGPKGVGFLYINSENKIAPFINGGGQERNMRGGTENLYGIIGLAKALEIAYEEMATHQAYIQGLKDYLTEKLKQYIPGVAFNGDCLNTPKSLYTVLNVSMPKTFDSEMLLFNLDIHKISVSGGSACTSGTDIGSHVLEQIGADQDKAHVRFSFSKYNTKEEIDFVLEKLMQIK